MEPFDLSHLSRSRAIDAAGIAWDDVPKHPLPADAVRTLRYMQDIETHTVIYLREMLSTRAIDDPEAVDFLACWVYEEIGHGRVLAHFLDRAGAPVLPRPRSRRGFAERFQAAGITAVAALWRDFIAVHMTWGAINEITALTAYRRLGERAGHPLLSELLTRIARDESRHFAFYYEQAARRLAASATTRRVTRALVDRFWAPVGTNVQPPAETRFMAAYLFDGPEGREAARTIDRTIRRLPGFDGVGLIEAWVARHASAASAVADRSHATCEPSFAQKRRGRTADCADTNR
ncbi:MAG: ferritin-like domain-containing protein [Candidatus Binatia bacterium]